MYTNQAGISLALAVWLAHDEYDYQDKPNYISATSLMAPLRHIVLGHRLDPKDDVTDVSDLIASAMGKALHDSIEKAWVKGYARSLKLLGYPESLIERVRINPSDEEVRGSNSMIPVYLEHRAFREIQVEGQTFTVGGKFDLVTEGIVQDAKSTSAYTWLHGGKDDDYRLQMSLYRWIDAAQPVRKITEEYGRINFIFTDWQKAQARSNPKYPQRRVEQKEIPLLSLQETEAWVRNKLVLIKRHWNTPESGLPECSDDELWRSDPVYKFYADATKANTPGARSTKNFDTLSEARAHQTSKGGVGTIVTVPGGPKRCAYCRVSSLCSQKDRYFQP